MSLSREELEQIYEIVDNLPFSKTKKNIHRDFSDGVMMSELLYYYFPKEVELHNYPQANSVATKTVNWETLNNKVLKKIGLHLKKKQIESIVTCVPNSIESFLKKLFNKVGEPVGEENLSPKDHMSNSGVHRGTTSRILPGRVDQNAGQFQDLQYKIQQAYLQLMKLNEISKLKDGVIHSLEKRVDQILYG